MCLSLYVVWNSYRVGKNSRTSEIRGMLVSRLVCLGSRFGWLVWRLLLFGAQTVVNHPLLLSDRSPRLAFRSFPVAHFSFWIDLCMYVTAPLQGGGGLATGVWPSTTPMDKQQLSSTSSRTRTDGEVAGRGDMTRETGGESERVEGGVAGPKRESDKVECGGARRGGCGGVMEG